MAGAEETPGADMALSNSTPRPREQWEDENQKEEDDDRPEGPRVGTKQRAKRERRQGSVSATMCQVCNMQLNSGAQAQIHYMGKTHKRKLRRLAKAVTAGALSSSHIHPLLGSLPLMAGSWQSQTLLEHFLPLRINRSTPLNLFPTFNGIDPVPKAVINHTFGVIGPKRKPTISCNVCHMCFNSTNQAEAHYKGHKHARKLKVLETQRKQKYGHFPTALGRNRTKEKGWLVGCTDTPDLCEDIAGLSSTSKHENGNGVTPTWSSKPPRMESVCLSQQYSHSGAQLTDLPSDGSTCWLAQRCLETSGRRDEDELLKSKSKHLHCPTCKVTVNSSAQLEAHSNGSKHKQKLGGQSQHRLKVFFSPNIRPKQSNMSRGVVSCQPFHCSRCQITVNSETQLKQHMNSRRHKEHLFRKHISPKLVPLSKLQPSAALVNKVALHKQLNKVLPSGFLSSHFNSSGLCALGSSPLTLQMVPGPTAIMEGSLISPGLFRPAPGPLRAMHAPVVFSPY
ncbi:zinc finger protein 385B-like isoform 1-T1 [Synchiropus picturatus]